MEEKREAVFKYKLGETVLVPARIVAVHQTLYDEPWYVVDIFGGEPEENEEYSFYEKVLKVANEDKLNEAFMKNYVNGN